MWEKVDNSEAEACEMVENSEIEGSDDTCEDDKPFGYFERIGAVVGWSLVYKTKLKFAWFTSTRDNKDCKTCERNTWLRYNWIICK